MIFETVYEHSGLTICTTRFFFLKNYTDKPFGPEEELFYNLQSLDNMSHSTCEFSQTIITHRVEPWKDIIVLYKGQEEKTKGGQEKKSQPFL